MATEAPPAPAPGEITIGKSSSPLNQKMVDAAAKYAAPGSAKVEIPEPVKPPEKKPEPVKAQEASKETAKEPAKAATPPEHKDEDDSKQSPKELREALKRANQALSDMRNEGVLSKKAIEEYQASISGIKSDLAKREEEIEKDLRPRAQRLTEAEKRLEEKEAILRVTNYTASDEWREKYDRPLAAARADIDLLMSEMEVKTADGNARPGKWDDFAYVLNAPTITQAHAVAEQIFGPGLAAMVLNKRADIQSKVRSRAEALKNSELESSKYYERQQASQAQVIEDRKKRLNELFSKIADSEPEVFKPDEKDTDAAESLREGLTLADRIIMGDSKITPDEMISTLAEVRAGMVREKSYKKTLTKKNAEISELKERLKQFESSEPSVGGGSTPQSGVKKTDRESVLSDMAARALKYAK